MNKLTNTEWILLMILSSLIFIAPCLAAIMACIMIILKSPRCFWTWVITKIKRKEEK